MRLHFAYFYFTIFRPFWRNPMSYLDLPRIHFGGLFFTGPNTINNITPNYEASTKLEGPNNQYIPQVAGWNALGVAQWWLEECTVLSAVGPDGAAVTGGDPLIGGRCNRRALRHRCRTLLGRRWALPRWWTWTRISRDGARCLG
jgi:hypothetical protein